MKKITILLLALCAMMAVKAANYDITIAGITVTDANKANVMGDGKVSYNPSTNTVTLDGATIDLEDGNFAIDCKYSKTLTIVLTSQSDNYISVSHMANANDAAIMSMGPITITSEENPGFVAKLKIVTYGTPELYTYKGDIRMEGPIAVTLNGEGNNNTGNMYNVNGGKFIIDGATVNMSACRIRMDTTIISRSKITSPTTAVVGPKGKIIRSGTTTEYDGTTKVTVSSLLHKIYLGPNPQSAGHAVSHDEEQPSTKRYYIWAAEDQVLELWAYPAKGYRLNGWYTPNPETLIGKTNPYNFTVPAADTIVYANFEKDVVDYTYKGLVYELDLYNKIAAVKGVAKSTEYEVYVRDAVRYNGEDYTVTSLANQAFCNTNIQYIELPATLQSIGAQAFYACSQLQEISYLTQNIVALSASDNVFSGTLSNIKLRVRRDKAAEFRNAAVWKDLDIVEIEEDASGIRYIYDPATNSYQYTYGILRDNYEQMIDPITLATTYNGLPVTAIGDMAFMHAITTEIYMNDNNLEYIGEVAFSYCYYLEKVRFSNSLKGIGDYAFYHCESLTSLVFPDKLESISRNAFERCEELLAISLPASLQWIGEDAFAYCTKLTDIINYAPEPLDIADAVFFGVNNRSSIKLYVPYGSKEKYEATDVWQDFNIVEMAPTGVEEVTENGLPVTGKEIRNGQLIIRRGGRVYNAVGVLME